MRSAVHRTECIATSSCIHCLQSLERRSHIGAIRAQDGVDIDLHFCVLVVVTITNLPHACGEIVSKRVHVRSTST